MTEHILFIHGAGTGAYDEDGLLVERLRAALGAGYTMHYPAMPEEDDAPYEVWKHRLEESLAEIPGPVILVGHSVGASVVIKYLAEGAVEHSIAGVFLMACPFWGGNGWLYEGYEELELPGHAAEAVPAGAPIFLYHCRDDAIAPFAHLALTAEALPQAVVRAIDEGGHQFEGDLSVIADDIRALR